MSFVDFNFDILDFLFLPMLFFIGTVTCYEDFRFCLVRNKWIKAGFFWGIGTLLFLLILSFFSKELSRFFFAEILGRKDQVVQLTISSVYLLKQFINAFLSLVVGFVMWKKRIWAAGDAKLFFIFALLLPLKYYQNSYLFIFPSLALLVNVFFPIFIFFSLKGLFFFLGNLFVKIRSFLAKGFLLKRQVGEELPKKEKANRKSIFKKLSFLKNMLAMLFIFMAIQLAPKDFFKKYFWVDVSYIQAIFITLLVIFQKKFFALISRPLVIFTTFFLFLISYFKSPLWLNPAETMIFAGKMFLMFGIFMIIFDFFNRAINVYLDRKGTRTIGVREIKKGMFIDKELLENVKSDRVLNQKFKDAYLEGLNQEQAVLLRDWLIKNKTGKVKIHTTFPFVFWMFLGVLLTIFFKGSVLSEILKLVFRN